MKITIKGAKPDGSDKITGELREITRTGGTLLQEDGKVVGFPLADIVAIGLSDEVTVQMEVTGFTFNRPRPVAASPGPEFTHKFQGVVSKFELGRPSFHTFQPIPTVQDTLEVLKQQPNRKVVVTYITKREVYVKKTDDLLVDLYTASDELKKECPGAEILGAVDQSDTSITTGLGTP